MSQITNPSGVTNRQVLPEGISIQVSQTWKTYAWNHAITVGEGDPTLNGLLPNNQRKPDSLPPLVHPKMVGIGDPSPEEARAISQNYMALPAHLESRGYEVWDEFRESFIQAATEAKRQLLATYGGATVPSSEILRYDRMVNQYSFRGVEVVVRGFVVSNENLKGSRQRKSDGKYVTERVLRRVTINKPLSETDLQFILSMVTCKTAASQARSAEYTVAYVGNDKGGNPVIAVTLKDVNGIPVGQSNKGKTGMPPNRIQKAHPEAVLDPHKDKHNGQMASNASSDTHLFT